MFPSLHSQGEKGWRKGNKVRENKRSQASGQGLVGKAGRREKRKIKEGREEDRMVGEKMRGKQASVQGCKVATSSFSVTVCSGPNLSLGHCCACVWCMVHVCVCLKLLGWVL